MDVGRVRIPIVLVAFLWVLGNNNSQGIRHFAGISSSDNHRRPWDNIIPDYSWSNIPRRLLRGKRIHFIARNPVLEASPAPFNGGDSSKVSKPLIITHPSAKDQITALFRSRTTHQLDKNNIIAISVSCFVAALSLVILLLVCIVNCRKTSHHAREGERERRDETPLPNFCSSEVSAACTQQSCSIAKSSDQISRTSPEVGNFSAATDTRDSSNIEEAHLPEEAAGAGHGNNQSLLPLPPGKSNLPAPGPPPPPKPPPLLKVAQPPNPPKPPPLLKVAQPPNPPKPPPLVKVAQPPNPPKPPPLLKVAQPPNPPPKSSNNQSLLLPLPPGRSNPPATGPPPPPPPKPLTPKAPPFPKAGRPPNPPKISKLGPSPLGTNKEGNLSLEEGSDSADDSPKAKLKPFFWEKVLANPDHSMVWDDIKEGSFQINEEMMESLFHYVPADKNKNDHTKDSTSQPQQPRLIQIIDPKKAQNLSILLKAWNVTTEEICDALKEGDEIPLELIQTLLKMALTSEEEAKLRSFNGDVSQLGPAERFLKLIVDIPFAFKRLEALLFMYSLQEESSFVAESFSTLEVACNELRNSRLFLKLLEAVLKTGNRMNDGTFRGGAQAFKLDTLLKLSDVKGTNDCKTTLLHYVVQEIIRSEGIKAAHRLRESQSISSVKTEDLLEDSSQETDEEHCCNLGLQVVSGLSRELENVKKAADIDGDIITATVSRLGHSLLQTKEFLRSEVMNVDEGRDFCTKLASFMDGAETDVKKLLEDEKRIMEMVRNTGDYFHGKAGKDEGLRLFTIVRDFLIMLDKVCNEVKNSANWPSSKTTPRKDSLTSSPPHHDSSSPDVRKMLFPAIKARRTDDFSSDEEESTSE